MPEQADIILIFPDQWRADCLGIAGHDTVDTPFIDELAAQGITFENAYSNAPTCIPARACLATGCSPSHTGRLGYKDGICWDYPVTLMSVLKDNGYQTMSSGKTHFYPERICLGFEQLKKYEAVARESADDYHEWLYRESRGRICDLPFSMDPNAACTHIDTLVGKLMSRLENSNSLHNTWIIFASDHGEMLGDHNMFAKGNPLEASCRIPLVIKPPKEYCGRTGIKSELPVTLADIMPTVLDICNIESGHKIDGSSLLPAFHKEAIEGRTHIHAEHTGSPLFDGGWQMLTDGKEKYIWMTKTGREMFFDIQNDPLEIIELSGKPDYSGRIAYWRKKLVDELKDRTLDGLVEHGRLKAGKILPVYRKEKGESYV